MTIDLLLKIFDAIVKDLSQFGLSRDSLVMRLDCALAKTPEEFNAIVEANKGQLMDEVVRKAEARRSENHSS